MARPTISIQAAIGPGTAATNEFIIGTSLIGGTDVLAGPTIVGQGTWVELWDRCYQFSTRRGRQRLLEQYRAGTFGGLFDNTDGYLTGAGTWTVRAMRAVRVVFTHSGIDYPTIYTYIDQAHPAPTYPEGGSVEIAATDAFKIFTRIDPLEQSPVGAGDDTGERLHRILDLAEWPTPLRDIDTGDNTHQATNMAQPIATQMRLAADSERGDLYIDGRGYPTFRRRLSRYLDTRSLNSQWTIGDGVGQFNPAGFEVMNDDELVRNDVNVARVGGSIQTRRSPDGEVAYLRASYTRTDLTLEDDVQVADHAERVLRLFKDQRDRMDSVTFEPDGVDDDALWAMIVGARFGDRVTCNLVHPSVGDVSGDYFIEGIDHDVPVEAAGQWRTTFSLADASKFPTNPFIIGSSLIGGPAVLVG